VEDPGEEKERNNWTFGIHKNMGRIFERNGEEANQ
jgi:hypothetical protein